MRRTALRIFIFALVSYLLAFLGAFVYHLIGYPEEQLLYIYRIPWVFEEALRSLVGLLPTVHITAILLALSVRSRRPGGAALEDPSATVRKSLLLFMLFTLLFAGLDIGLHPVLHRNRHNRLYLSRLAMDYLERARTADEAGELASALELYRDYLSINPENELVDNRADKIAGRLASEEGEDETAPAEPPPLLREYRNLTPAELIERGRARLEEEDPFTAHFFARLALELEPQREDARRLAGQAWEMIRRIEPKPSEREEHEIYERKVAGYNALDRDRPIEAYYIFEQLRERAPADPDVREYYRISRERARGVSYFLDDARQLDTMPGVRKVLYLEPRDEAPRRVVFFDKLVHRRNGTWVQGAEFLTFEPDGTIRSHLYAPYGKVVGSSLVLRGIHRSDRSIGLEPEYLAGAPPEEGPEQIIPLVPEVQELQLLSQRRDYLERLSLLDLVRLEPMLSRFGFSPLQVQLSVLRRLHEPFLFFILSFFAAALGMRFRARRRRFPVLLLIVVPLVPLAVYTLLETYRYAFLLGFSLFISLTGLTVTLLLFLASQGLLLFLGMLFVATFREP